MIHAFHENWRTTAVRIVKFNTVGAIGIAVQLITLSILKSGLQVNYLLATALAVETAVLHNFAWHERFTWVDRSSGTTRDALARLLRFNLTTGMVSLIGNVVLMRLLVAHAHLHYLVANLLTIATCSLANFLVSDQMVFRRLNSQ